MMNTNTEKSTQCLTLEQALAEARACLPIEMSATSEGPALEAQIAELSAALDNAAVPLPPDEHDRVVADLALFTAKYTTLEIRHKNSKRRWRVYSVPIAGEINRLAGEIKAGLVECQKIVRQRVTTALTPYFSQEDLPGVVTRSRDWRSLVGFQNGLSTGRDALKYTFDGSGVPVLSPACTTSALLNAIEVARSSAEATRKRLAELKAAR